MMVILRFSKAFEYRIYLGVVIMLYMGVGWAYMVYTKPEVHVIKNLYYFWSILFYHICLKYVYHNIYMTTMSIIKTVT